MYYVYIMSSNNNNVLYVGMTNNLARRVYEHKEGLVDGFTKKYNVHKLLYYEETDDVWSALEREKQLKKWRRDKKEFLINIDNQEWADLAADWS